MNKIILHDYQKRFVDKCTQALIKHGDTLGVAPTGAGKTLILASVIKELYEQNKISKVCVIAHRKELTEQNTEKFLLVNPYLITSLVNAETKDWSGEVVFAMVQTLSNKRTLCSMVPVDLLVIDETHHITAKSYKKIIDHAKVLNPNVKLFGVTATPNRGDKHSLGNIFTNCAEQIPLLDLIEDGYLVAPKTFVVDVAKEKLEALKLQKTGDYADSEVAEILDTEPILEQVISTWQQYAGDRKTVIFCSDIEHAKNVTRGFLRSKISAVMVSCKMSKEERELALALMTSGDIQVIVNVAILTEGWDFPPISCIILLRQSSYKSTMIQMIGRGLRTVDPNIYPNVDKKDCIVLDFGISTLLHKSLEDEVKLEKEDLEEGKKEGDQECPNVRCKKIIPLRVKECPFCHCNLKEYREYNIKKQKESYVFKKMEEIQMLKRSEIDWIDLEDNAGYFASGFNFWVCIFCNESYWKVISGENKNQENTSCLYEGKTYKDALKAAERFLYANETRGSISKDSYWRRSDASEKQLKALPKKLHREGLSKGEASSLLNFCFNVSNKLKDFGLMI